VSTVTIVDEQPAEVFRHLSADGSAMRFRPTLPSAVKSSRSEATEPPAIALDLQASPADATVKPDGESEEPQPAELDFAPYDPEALDERHTDDVLQALATPEALDKSLRRLDEQARGTIEEQGVNVLFLALGMLHYTGSADSDEVYRAPLVMIPVSLSRKSARSGYTVAQTDDDAIVNPALIEYLRTSFGIELPALGIGDAEGTTASLQSFYKAIADVAAERARAGMKGWAVKTDIFLGMFSFQKLVMFKDLEANSMSFARHELVRRLITRERDVDGPVMGLPNDVRVLDHSLRRTRRKSSTRIRASCVQSPQSRADIRSSSKDRRVPASRRRLRT
jgi:hypothetical protein